MANHPSLANAWAINPDTLPPMQHSQHVYDRDDHQQGIRNTSFDQRNLDLHLQVQEQTQHRPHESGSASQGSDDEDGEGEGEGESDRSHSRTRSGSGSGGIKELLN
jgi:hypothetical protein